MLVASKGSVSLEVVITFSFDHSVDLVVGVVLLDNDVDFVLLCLNCIDVWLGDAVAGDCITQPHIDAIEAEQDEIDIIIEKNYSDDEIDAMVERKRDNDFERYTAFGRY